MALEAVDELLYGSDKDVLWELFHENSKVSFVEPHLIFKRWPSDATISEGMKLLRRVKPYRDLPKLALPTELPAAHKSFDEAVLGRHGARAFGGGSIRLEQLAKVLWMSYGVNRSNADNDYPRPFRMIPSGGAMYPLEIYVHASRVEGLAAGLYHYDPEDHAFDVLHRRDDSQRIAGHMIQVELARKAAAIVFITAIFVRSTFKYADRGYRFILLEAGHLAQNANLTAQEMDLATANIGGYDDRAIDRYLGLDGLNESTVYVLHIGQPAAAGRDEPAGPDPGTEKTAGD